MDNSNLLTIEEISLKINKSIKFVRREVAKGSISSSRIKNKIMIKKNEFEKWFIENQENLIATNSSKDFFSSKNRINDYVNFINVENDMQKIDCWKNPEKISNLNFIDLFTGAGGLSCGLVMAGFKPISSCEIMKEAVETYTYNFKKINSQEKVITSDIRDKNIKDSLINSVKDKHIHLISGGFPCQGFSIAGNRIVLDPRNSLYLDMLYIVSKIKPDFILMENVEGLRSMLNGEIEKKIIYDYKKIGYKINVTTLNSADYGVPQIRKRVIFIGNRIGKVNYHPLPIYNQSNYKTVRDGISRFLDISENKEINHIFTKSSKEILAKLEKLEVGKSLYENYRDAWKKVDWNKPSCTVKENHGGVNVHPIKNRLMTPRELAALQSFPDDFIFKGSKKWQLVQIGNAVPPLLAKAVGLAIIKSLDEKNE